MTTPPHRLEGVRWPRLLRERREPKWDSFSWLTVRALFSSVNDVIAKHSHEVVQRKRVRWVAERRAFAPDFVIDRRGSGSPARFLVIGDTGEADASQYACVDPLLAVHRAKDTGFMVILSDVVYPAGDVNDYVNGFYIPYRDYDRPIYAIPGNHDCYDGLDGFMLAFCDAQPLPALGFRAASYRPSELVAGMLWRGSSSPDYRRLGVYRHERARRAPGPPQPGP